jgi:hypothetical protein
VSPPSEVRASNCDQTSLAFTDKYGRYDYHIPNSSTPVKTIMINFNVFQDDNGGNNWQDTPADLAHFDDIMLWLNNAYQHNNLPSDPISGVPYIDDTRIRFEIGGIYFYQNTALSQSSSASTLLNHIGNVDPDRLNQLNICLTNGSYGNASGFSTTPSSTNFDYDQYIVTFNSWNNGNSSGYYAFGSNHLAHELGHCLDLLHTYEESCCPETCVQNDPDYLSDVFGTGASAICHHDAGWECDPFASGNTCTNNMLGGTQAAGYFSPMQMGKMHRALALKSVRRYVKNCAYSSTPRVVEHDETWDFNIKFYSDLIIEPGATVTMTCKLLMPDQGRIIVEPGAELIIDGGDITDGCDDFWKGIEVRGNPNQHQYAYNGGNYYQGRLIMKNEASIHNARNAVVTRDWNNWGYHGGIIQAKNSSFINCRRAIEFMSYHNFDPSDPTEGMPNRSYFIKCHFEWNDDYLYDLDSDTQEALVTLWDIEGVTFSGCSFLSDGTVSSSLKREAGILSLDANYTVKGYCFNPIPQAQCSEEYSTFTGFHTGIDAGGAQNTVDVKVKHSIFEECMRGVHLKGADFSEVIFNEFIIGEHPFSTGILNNAREHVGVIAEETSFYSIEENDFTEAANPIDQTKGVLITNAGGTSNELYQNYFSNLTSASIAYGHNRNKSGIYGLKFLCNENIGNEHDFEVRSNTPNPVSSTSGISSFQSGDTQYDRSAGNTFSAGDGNNSNYVHFDFKSPYHYNYLYNMNVSSQVPSAVETFITSPGEIDLDDDGDPNGCPTHYSPYGPTIGLSNFLAGKDGYNGLLYAYEAIIDDGDTDGMLNEIALTWPEDAWDLRDEMMARAPYNSEEILMVAADKGIMPQSMLLEVLLANPDALKSGRLISHVACCIPNPLPQYMIDMLYAARDQQTLRTEMENSLSSLHLNMTRSNKRLIQYYLTDTLEFDKDSVLIQINQMNDIPGRYARSTAYANLNNYTEAIAQLDSIATSFKLSSDQSAELSAMEDLYLLFEEVYNQSRTLAELKPTHITELQNIAGLDLGKASLRAKNVLCFFYNMCSPESPITKGSSNKNAVVNNSKEGIEDNPLDKIKFGPNPADEHITFEYLLSKAPVSTSISILNSNGAEIKIWELEEYQGQKLLDTRQLSPGTYFVVLSHGDQRLFSDKFIVAH